MLDVSSKQVQEKLNELVLNAIDYTIIQFLKNNADPIDETLVAFDVDFIFSNLINLNITDLELQTKKVSYIDANILTPADDEKIKNLLTSKTELNRKLGLGNYRCNWCNCEKNSLHEIAYNSETANVCSNCKDTIEFGEFYIIDVSMFE